MVTPIDLPALLPLYALAVVAAPSLSTWGVAPVAVRPSAGGAIVRLAASGPAQEAAAVGDFALEVEAAEGGFAAVCWAFGCAAKADGPSALEAVVAALAAWLRTFTAPGGSGATS